MERDIQRNKIHRHLSQITEQNTTVSCLLSFFGGGEGFLQGVRVKTVSALVTPQLQNEPVSM